jgi:hypothetical protein
VSRAQKIYPEGAQELIIEVHCQLNPRKSELIEHHTDRQVVEKLVAALAERGRFFPGALEVAGQPCPVQMDFNTVGDCSFTSYTLVGDNQTEGPFAAAHPWAHGARFLLDAQGKVADLYSLSGEKADRAPGNMCHIPELHPPAVGRRWAPLKRPDDKGIDISPPGNLRLNTYLKGHNRYLLEPRTVLYGSPPTPIVMRPLRVSQLFFCDNRKLEHFEAPHLRLTPVIHGIALDPIRVPYKGGALLAIANCPPDLPTTPDGLRLKEKDPGVIAWGVSVLEEFERRLALLEH